jgi:hypothetical protein
MMAGRTAGPPTAIHLRITMDHRRNPENDRAAQARALFATAANRIKQLEATTSEAVRRLAALTGMLARLEKLAGSDVPHVAEAALLGAAMLCREARALLRSLDQHGKRPSVMKVVLSPAAARPSVH